MAIFKDNNVFVGKETQGKKVGTYEIINVSENPIKISVKGNYNTSLAPNGGGGDALHSFDSRKSDNFGGAMNGIINSVLLSVYNKNINPYVSSLSIKFGPNEKTGPMVYWEATITKSPDNKAYVGINSRGGAGDVSGGTAKDRALIETNKKKKAYPNELITKENPLGEPNMTFLDVLDYNNPYPIRQIFFQYTKPIDKPPHPKDSVPVVSPVVPIVTSTQSTQPVNTGVSQSVPLNVFFPSGFQAKVREDVPKFTIWVGDPQPIEVVDGFIFEGDNAQVDENGNLVTLSNEYIESEYSGVDDDFDFIVFNDGGFVKTDSDLTNDVKGYDPENPDESLLINSNKYPISKNVDQNINIIVKVSKENGITNKFSIAAMLAISKKECGLVPQSEGSYAKSESSRIKKIFSKMRSYSDSEVDRIKKSPKEFFDIIYGNKYGNGSTDGFKYRGRGFNQITFKSNYQKYKDLSKIDIVSDPDLLNKVDVAARCLVEYFKSNFKKAPSDIKGRYKFSDINSFKSLEDATGAFYHANAGWGKSYSEIIADSTGGRKKAFNYVGQLYNTYKDKM